MKATLTRPDGTKIEVEGTPEEVREALARLSPAPISLTPYAPPPYLPPAIGPGVVPITPTVPSPWFPPVIYGSGTYTPNPMKVTAMQ